MCLELTSLGEETQPHHLLWTAVGQDGAPEQLQSIDDIIGWDDTAEVF